MTFSVDHITTFKHYIAAVKRTESIERTGWQAAIPDRIYRVMHGLIGLSTELAEMIELLDRDVTPEFNHDHFCEELGDLWWYLAIICDELDSVSDFEEVGRRVSIYGEDALDLLLMIQRAVGEGFDVIKRRIYYNVPDAEPKASWDIAGDCAFKVLGLLDDMGNRAGFNAAEVWQANIRKLAARYPAKFTTEDAIDRDLDAEVQALKGTP